MRATRWAGVLLGLMILSAPGHAATGAAGAAAPEGVSEGAAKPASKLARHRLRVHVAKRSRHPRRAAGKTEIGLASWYGRERKDHRTTSGEPFDPKALTAAHRSLPLHSRARVTNIRNGRSVTVRITDRGPHEKGRVIDLSEEAAKRLGMRKSGVARVRVEALPPVRAAQAEP
jgi:rare lipoprotein A